MIRILNLLSRDRRRIRLPGLGRSLKEMKPIDRNAFYLIPATTLTVVCFFGITNALSPVTLSTISEASNRPSFFGYLVFTVIACASGLGLIFRIRTAYPVSVVATTFLLGLAIHQLVGLSQRAPKMDQSVSGSLLVASAVHIFVLIVILIMLSLGPTRERCFPPNSEHAGDGKPDPVSS